MAPIPDERLERVAQLVGSAKVTHAALRIVDVPGSEAAALGGVRGCDALVAVVNTFGSGSTPSRNCHGSSSGSSWPIGTTSSAA